MKRYVALARVSSREQEREGFSLAVQEDALRKYAEKNGGTIVRLFRIAETASKRDERKTFKEMIAYAKKHSLEIDGLLFYKVDRAARNLFDYVELERLESEYQVPFISISQQTDDNPAGRMMRRTLANMASFFTEQMAVDISQGINRRVQEGLFPGKAPYGFKHVRVNGRRLIETNETEAANVRTMFQLYAYGNCTLDGIVKRFEKEGIAYRHDNPNWSRTSVHNMLNDRAYIGDVRYKDNWYPGSHEVLIDRATWDRVQALLGNRQQVTHSLVFAGDLIECGFCGHKITGESKIKQTKSGPREYVYYRCTKYNRPDHPRTRIKEADLDQQVLAFFGRIRIDDDSIRDWFRAVLASKTKDAQAETKAMRSELQRQSTLLADQQDRLLNLRIDGQIDDGTFAAKNTQLRDRHASIVLQLEALNRSRDENAELASRVFELSQTLTEKWLSAEYAEKRQILEIVWLNCRLDDVTLVPTIRKPFDVLAEGLSVPQSGG
ncbi:recombinase family protein [bacterium]|nr:recombinase family protein [bacterium]